MRSLLNELLKTSMFPQNDIPPTIPTFKLKMEQTKKARWTFEDGCSLRNVSIGRQIDELFSVLLLILKGYLIGWDDKTSLQYCLRS